MLISEAADVRQFMPEIGGTQSERKTDRKESG